MKNTTFDECKAEKLYNIKTKEIIDIYNFTDEELSNQTFMDNYEELIDVYPIDIEQPYFCRCESKYVERNELGQYLNILQCEELSLDEAKKEVMDNIFSLVEDCAIQLEEKYIINKFECTVLRFSSDVYQSLKTAFDIVKECGGKEFQISWNCIMPIDIAEKYLNEMKHILASFHSKKIEFIHTLQKATTLNELQQLDEEINANKCY